MSETTFSDFSAQDTHLAALEAQQWIEAAVGKKFSKKSFRESLEDGVLLCELMNKISPGSIRKINKSKSPIAYLDNIQQFLYRCQDLGLNDAQLFDIMDLQENKVAKKTGVKRNEADRRIRSVCITLYWLGRSVAELEDYDGPQLDLNLFKKLMDGTFSGDENDGGNEEVTRKQLNHKRQENPIIEPPLQVKTTRIESPVVNGAFERNNDLGVIEQAHTADELGLTFEQEQTADELLADIQNAVDEMLQDFQTSPVTANPPPVAPKKKKIQTDSTQDSAKPYVEHMVRMKSKNGGFGFQIMGGVDSDLEAQVDYIVPGSPADISGLQVGDMMIHVNGQNIQHLSHVNLVGVIKTAGQMGELTLGVNRTGASNSGTASHSPLNESVDSNFGFSRRESRDKWEEDNEERERQAQEIALLYPHRGPIENGHSGPPTTFGTAPLPPLVEHQEEALFEQFQEMIDSAPSPPPTPPASPQAQPSLPSSNSSHPVTPLTVSPSNQLQDDKETIEREIEELALMAATKPTMEDTLSFSASENEEEVTGDWTSSHMDDHTRGQQLNSDEETLGPVELENENSIAIKYDAFRVEESNSPLPLSPITEVSPDAEMSTDADTQADISAASPPPPDDPAEMLDKELDDLLNFSGSTGKTGNTPQAEGNVPQEEGGLPQAEENVTPTQNEELTPSDAIVTPPPMFDSPPPPKPKTEAPKRVAKRPAPPPPKPKPKPEATPATAPQPLEEEEAPVESSVDSSSPPPPVNGMLSDDPFQRSQSPDLVTQMQELAYSKSITSSADWGVLQVKPATPDQAKPNTYDPFRYSQGQLAQRTMSLPRNMPTASLNQSPYHQNQAAKFPPQSLAISSNGPTSTLNNTEQATPKLVEVLGDIKIQQVRKKRWTPKSSSAEPSPVQTPEHLLQSRSATLPNVYNGYGYSSNGGGQTGQGIGMPSVVMAKGIGAGIGRPAGMGGQNQNKFQPIPARGNPYQQTMQQQQQQMQSQQMQSQQMQSQQMPAQQSWKSQEELRQLGTYNQQRGNQYARQRLSSTPEGTRDYRVQKSMSLPRGYDSRMNGNRANTIAGNRGGATSVDGYQVAYTTQVNNPHDLCSRCHQPLGQGSVLTLPGLRTVYHVKCFVCRVCRSALSQGGQSTSVMIKNRQPHCRFCVSGENGTQTTEC